VPPPPFRSDGTCRLERVSYQDGTPGFSPVPPPPTIAQQLASKQREISVAEFFERNRQILGFDNLQRALLTTVKEAVDNSVEWSEPVLVRQNGVSRLVRIGEFVDAVFDTPPSAGTESHPVDGCEVLAFNESTYRMSWQPASKVHRHPLHGDLFEITLVGGRKVTVTGSHSVFALREGRIQPERVDTLRPGDHVVVPRKSAPLDGAASQIDLREIIPKLPRTIRRTLMIRGVAQSLPVSRDCKRFDFVPYSYFEEHGIELPDYASVSVRNGRSQLPVIIPLNAEIARFLGYYAAEGTCYSHLVTLSFGAHEAGLIADAQRCARAWGGSATVTAVRAHPTAVAVKVYSTILAIVLRLGLKAGGKARDKAVPDLIWNLRPDLIREFIDGYVAGDGYRGGGRVIMTTISEKLQIGMQYLLGLSGQPYSVSRRPVRITRFPQGHTSRCRPVYALTYYDGSSGNGAPINRLPLNESGLRLAFSVGAMLLPYTDKHRYNWDVRRSFEIPSARESLERLRAAGGGAMQLQASRLIELVDGDISALPISRIRRVSSRRSHVYDFSVPGSEKFLGGRGPIFLHNSLDACEDARQLPEVMTEIAKEGEDRFRISVTDNGPGILRKEIPNVFARLLYGSRFHANRQARGQQGIGISAAVLYANLTTARPARITSKVAEEEAAHVLDLVIDTQKNQPRVVAEDLLLWDRPHGTRLELVLKARYLRGRQSALEYLRGTAIVNPHARLVLVEPDGTRTTFERAAQDLPPLSKETLPHPYGLELGDLGYLLKSTKRPTLGEFLSKDLAGVSTRSSREVLERTGVASKVPPGTLPGEVQERLLKALHEVPLVAPSSDSLSPIGSMLIKRGLRNVLGELRPEFFAPPVSRPPRVHAGFPFLVEVGLVYGGGLPADQPVQILRFANRVPLLFQQGACAITNAIANLDWRRYGLDQKGGSGIPSGPAVILVHLASTKVPFTSEAKEAVAEDPEIDKEITLALQAEARHLRTHISRQSRRAFAGDKFEIIQRILPKLAEKTSHLLGKPIPDLTPVITRIMDVVNVESTLVPAAEGVRVQVEITNYTPRSRVLELFVEIPPDEFALATFEPAPDGSEPGLGRAWWTLKKLAPSGRTGLTASFPPKTDLEANDFDWYVAGIDESHILGADPLPGDWEVRLPRTIIEAAESAAAEEAATTADGEVDYDAAETSAGTSEDE
jgi:DNA topoisomerase VI subunit B